MKIAIPSDEGTFLSQHFGRTLGFAVYEVDQDKIVSKEYRKNDFTGHVLGQHEQHQHHGEEHQNHARHSHHRILNALNDCEVVIAGGMGRRLLDDLTGAGKKIFITTEPEVRKVIEMFIDDTLQSDKSACSHQH